MKNSNVKSVKEEGIDFWAINTHPGCFWYNDSLQVELGKKVPWWETAEVLSVDCVSKDQMNPWIYWSQSVTAVRGFNRLFSLVEKGVVRIK